MRRLLLIDGHAIIHRAFHALPMLTTKDGMPTNAIYGFFGMMQKALADLQPDQVIVAFDTPAPTFRKKLLEEYQAKRPSMQDELKVQIPVIKELLDVAPICRMEREGFEADDIIGTLVELHRNTHTEVLILTGDRDMLQLVNSYTKVIMPKIGLSTISIFDAQAVQEKLGIGPELVADFKALSGDASDNYGGIKGLGPKTATKLLLTYGTIDNIYAQINAVQPKKLQNLLKEHQELVIFLKKIATIRRDVQLTLPASYNVPHPFSEELKQRFISYQMKSLLKKYYNIDLNTLNQPAKHQARPAAKTTPDDSQPGLL
jgi:DNA polymerase-1